MLPFYGYVRFGESCWEWTGAIDDNYGVAWRNGKKTGAHRAAYEMEYGLIPEGMQVLHRCDNPPCVRPDHLFLGTHADNMADRSSKNRQSTGSVHGEFQRRKTHCPKGHEYTPENTYYGKQGNGWQRRKCRKCQRKVKVNE